MIANRITKADLQRWMNKLPARAIPQDVISLPAIERFLELKQAEAEYMWFMQGQQMPGRA